MNSTRPNNQGSNGLILVVDDNTEFLDGVQLTLEMEGYQVWTATDGQQALDKLKAAFQDTDLEDASLDRLPDLILADIMMPVMDGYAFYEEVRANPYLNHIPIIFLTAKSSEVDIRHGKELGADDYLTKPVSPEDLLASVRGKLKRVRQRQMLMERFFGDTTNSRGVVFLVVAVAAIIVIFIFVLLLIQSWG